MSNISHRNVWYSKFRSYPWGRLMAKDRILVVEDEEALGEILCSLLEERGDSATHACNGKEALGVLKSSPEAFQLVLSDIVMPEMNGIQFLEQARRLYPDLPIIILSALHDIMIAMEAIRLGAYDYVV